MAIKEYRDFVLVARDVERDEAGVEQFSVEVFGSPRGGGLRVTKQKITPDLRKELGRLERRKLEADGLISLGEKLADLLLPGEIRELFRGCVDTLKSRQGLRLRLRLDPALADIPWEYIYLPREGGARDSTGFLALDPRVSIARHEALQISGDFDDTPRRRRMLAALASPEGEEPLDLDRERENLEEAMRDVPDVDVDFVENATVQALADELVAGADMFHFAGHGVFKRTGLGVTYRTAEGEGAILLVAEDGSAAAVPAEELAVNLRGRGVELVVLGACQTGKRGEGNVWSGVAAALMNAGIPVVVAMQYGIWDDAAIAFHRGFYRGLAAGLPLDYAVSGGRLAAFNRCHPVREDPELGKCWRDWGVPVLYTRAERDFVLPAIRDAAVREAVTAAIDAVAERRRTIIVTGAPDEARADTLPKRRPRRLLWSGVGAAVVTAAVVTVLALAGVFSPEKGGSTVEKPPTLERGGPGPTGLLVPGVVGLMEDEARAKLEESGFEQGRIESAPVESDAPRGIVVDQSPPAGTEISNGRTIGLDVSTGPPGEVLVEVPSVVGYDVERAVKKLEGEPYKFNVDVIEQRLAVARFDRVARTDPPAGEKVAPGSYITLYLGTRPSGTDDKVSVPNLIGKPYDAAREILAERGLRFGPIREVQREDVKPGIVTAQSPPPGERVGPGTAVGLDVCVGPEKVRVPNLVGKTYGAARGILAEGGLRLGPMRRVPRDGVKPGIVIGQSRPPGEMVNPGTEVAIDVCAGPEPKEETPRIK